ncbi:TIGR02444 family protein [Pseudaeromonas pectinilytica]
MLTANEFWELSQSLYAAPAVQSACLLAQHQHGAEVNLLLLLALLQTRGWRGDYRPLLYAAAPLLPVLQDLRLLRRALKPKLAPSDYARLLTHELSLERQMQQRLLAALEAQPGVYPATADRQTPACVLADYLGSIGVTTPQRQDLIALLLAQASIIHTAGRTSLPPLSEGSPC